ncbi:MAG TPA: hypothetical protein VN922_23400, partial [Bacteroidia bacterium]|nr:hypothetical protein [Bacteroidia bacterium]
MKKIYLFTEFKTSIILGFILSFNIYYASAQVEPDAEDKSILIRDEVYQGLKQETGMSENELSEFIRYYSDTLSQDIGKTFRYFRENPTATENDLKIQQYIMLHVARYSILYHRYKQIKAEFPSSIAESLTYKWQDRST